MEKEVDINTTLQHEGYNCCCGASAAAQRGSGLAADREQLRSLHEKNLYGALFRSTASAERLKTAKIHMEAAYKAIEGACTARAFMYRLRVSSSAALPSTTCRHTETANLNFKPGTLEDTGVQ